MTQEQLGELSGLDRKTVNRIERGLRPADTDELVMLSAALKVHPGELFT